MDVLAPLPQSRILSGFFAASACCWLMVTSHQDSHRSFSAKLLPSPIHPLLCYWRGLFLPRCRTLHLSLLNFIRFMLASSAHLNSSKCQPFSQRQCQIHFIWTLEPVSLGRQQKTQNTPKFSTRKRTLDLDNCQYRSARSVSQKRTFSMQLLMLSHRDAEPKVCGQYGSLVHYYIILTSAKEVLWTLSYLNSPLSKTIRTKLWFISEWWYASGWNQTKHWASCCAMHL